MWAGSAAYLHNKCEIVATQRQFLCLCFLNHNDLADIWIQSVFQMRGIEWLLHLISLQQASCTEGLEYLLEEIKTTEYSRTKLWSICNVFVIKLCAWPFKLLHRTIKCVSCYLRLLLMPNKLFLKLFFIIIYFGSKSKLWNMNKTDHTYRGCLIDALRTYLKEL